MRYTLTLQESHYEALRNHLIRKDQRERVAFIICGRSKIGSLEERFLTREVILFGDDKLLISRPNQVKWDNYHFIKILKDIETKGFAVVIIHNHPSGFEDFSKADDEGEYHLFKLTFNRNGGTRPHASLIMMPDGLIFGRAWKSDLSNEPLSLIRIIGKTFQLYYPNRLKNYQSPEAFHRQQLAFGKALIQDLSQITCTVVGAGATGSATALLLTRLGIGTINIIDKDIVEKTNLNRLHGATVKDIGKSKVDVLRKSIEEIGLGTRVNVSSDWVDAKSSIELLKSSDIIFGCTDDHAGRILLNRFAYFYLTPVIDMGLFIKLKDDSSGMQSLQGRISYLYPGSDCLLTNGNINMDIAIAENLKRKNPEQYNDLKNEKYVIGEGNQSPSVVTFTTQIACMAVNEFLNRIQKFNPNGFQSHKLYFFN